jgi:hypothetical protein
MNKNKTISKLTGSMSLSLPMLLLSSSVLLVSGCSQSEIVGEAGSGGTQAETEEVQTGTGAAPAQSSDCSVNAAAIRAPYEEWKAEPNQVESLLGSTWTGHILGGFDLTLTIAEDLSAVLQVGEAVAAPVKDEGYLCDNNNCNSSEIRDGGSYAVHGATFTNNRLRFDLALGAAYDAWCQLQIPSDYGDCVYMPYPNETKTMSTECAVGEKVVDCDWLALHFPQSTCNCTAAGCFSQLFQVPFDVTYDADEQAMEGVMGQSQVVFTRVEDEACSTGAAGASSACAN